MRAADIAECAAFGHSPKAALRESLLASAAAWTATVDGCPEAMFGLVVNSALTGEGAPWFLGTDAVWRHGRALLLHGPAILAHFHDSTPRLAGLVSADNAPALRMLGKWGFVLGESRTLRGTAFVEFARARA